VVWCRYMKLYKYLVCSKGDDYGANRLEVVETTLKNIGHYYGARAVDEEDFDTLTTYINFIPRAEERTRSEEERFYGR